MNMYEGKLIMYACIIRETFVFTVFRASVSFDFETRIMSTCMSTSRSNYTDHVDMEKTCQPQHK